MAGEDNDLPEGDLHEVDIEISEEDLDEDFDGVLAEDELDDDALGDGELDDGELEGEDEDVNKNGKAGSARGQSMADDEDDDGESADPDDVEDDLDTILKDRLAVNDDQDEEEDVPEPNPAAPSHVVPKREDEWTCEGCFFIVSTSQFGSLSSPRCPSGEDPCPSLKRL